MRLEKVETNKLRLKHRLLSISSLFTFYFLLFNLRSVLLFTFYFLLFTLMPVKASHTFHTSLTRMDYNAQEKLAEVSIQLFVHDLLPTLEKRAKKRIDLEKTADVDKFIQTYLEENFILKDKKEVKKKLVWIGKEIKVDTIFVYFEIPLAEDFGGYSLQNTLFFESFPEQTNLVIARFNQQKADLLFKVGDKFKEIKLNEGKN